MKVCYVKSRQQRGTAGTKAPDPLSPPPASPPACPPCTAPSPSAPEMDPFTAWWRNRDDLITLAYATATGGIVAASVFVFDVSIQYIHDLPDIAANVSALLLW